MIWKYTPENFWVPWTICFKVVCSHCILIPKGSTGGSTFFWCQMKAHIFLIIIPKFQLQIHHTLEVIRENIPISGVPILNFLRIFITDSSLVSQCHILTFASGEQTRSNLEDKLNKMCLRGQDQSVESEKKKHVKMDTTLCKMIAYIILRGKKKR